MTCWVTTRVCCVSVVSDSSPATATTTTTTSTTESNMTLLASYTSTGPTPLNFGDSQQQRSLVGHRYLLPEVRSALLCVWLRVVTTPACIARFALTSFFWTLHNTHTSTCLFQASSRQQNHSHDLIVIPVLEYCTHPTPAGDISRGKTKTKSKGKTHIYRNK